MSRTRTLEKSDGGSDRSGNLAVDPHAFGILDRRTFLLALSTVAGCSRTDTLPPYATLPWDSDEAERRALGTPIQTHGYDSGVALSADGNLLAATIQGRPINELQVFQHGKLDQIVIIHPNSRVGLADPSFDKLGQSVALVASPLARFGISKIHIADLTTGALRVIGDPFRSYRYPAFSPDGSRLAYLRDTSPDPRPRPGLMRPEYREFIDWGVFVRDLRSGEETFLGVLPFSRPRGLYYDAVGRGLFYSASGLKVRAPGAASGYMSAPDADEYDRAINYSSGFLVPWGTEPEARPSPFASELSKTRTGAVLEDVISDGSLLVTAPEGERVSDSRIAIRYASDAGTILSWPSYSLNRIRASNDAEVIGGSAETRGDSSDPLVHFFCERRRVPEIVSFRAAGRRIELLSKD